MKRRFLCFIILGLFVSVVQNCATTGKIEYSTTGNLKITNPDVEKIEIPFQLINNLIVVPVRINDSDTLHFILDTGVSRIIVTDLPKQKEITLNYTQQVLLKGIGSNEPIEALYSEYNQLYMKGIKGEGLVVVAIPENIFELSKVMGSEVNGLMGYDVFNDFIVEMDYMERKIFLHDPNKYARRYNKKKNSRFWKTIDLSIERRKPYAKVSIKQKDDTDIDVTLLVDSGASHALALYHSTDNRISIPDKKIFSYLGTGLSGDIYGDIGRAQTLHIGGIKMKEPVVFYPEEDGIEEALSDYYKNGSIGAEVLKRFKTFISYQDSTMIIRRNHKFKTSFYYNMAGIEVHTPFPDLPIFEVSRVRPGSPADLAGIKVMDLIEEMNMRKAPFLTLNDIYDVFLNDRGKKVTLILSREGEENLIKTSFRLVDATK